MSALPVPWEPGTSRQGHRAAGAAAEVISIKELLGHAPIKSSERYAKLSNQRVKQVYQQAMRKVIAKTRV